MAAPCCWSCSSSTATRALMFYLECTFLHGFVDYTVHSSTWIRTNECVHADKSRNLLAMKFIFLEGTVSRRIALIMSKI